MIAQALCKEPTGQVLRRAVEFTCSPENMLWLYDKLGQVPNFLSSDKPLPVGSLRLLVAGEYTLFLIDDVGVIAIPQPVVEHCHVHITFWDRRLRGREPICRAVARYILDHYHLDFIWTAIPQDSRVVIAFARRIGFVDFVPEVHEAVALKLDRTDLHHATQEMI